jgi:hypothetical protein
MEPLEPTPEAEAVAPHEVAAAVALSGRIAAAILDAVLSRRSSNDIKVRR